MGIPVLVLGYSSSGKTSSLRNLDPKDVLLINAGGKPLPFKSKEWKEYDPKKETGSVVNEINLNKIKNIVNYFSKMDKKILIIDDFQFSLAKYMFDRADEKTFDKWTDLGSIVFQLVETMKNLPKDKICFIMSHMDDTDDGSMKMKTVGKLIDNQVNIPGWVIVTLGAYKNVEDKYVFVTNSKPGFELCKTPLGMFEDLEIDNDLKIVINAIKDYWNLDDEGK